MSRWLCLFAIVSAPLIAGESDAAYLMYVADYANEEVRRYHPDTGELVDVFASVPAAQGVAFASNGDLLAGAYYDHNVRRFDVASKTPMGVFAQGPGDLFPTGLTFGQDGDLFVSSYETPQVLRFDGLTGAYEGVFAAANGGRGFTHCEFGPNGDLFVSDPSAGAVLRYDGSTGASKGVFASSNELGSPHAFTFNPTGDMIVASAVFDRILRFDGNTGEYRGLFAEYLATDLSVSPDGDVFGSAGRYIRRFDGRTGAFKGVVVDEPGANMGDIAYGPVPEPSAWLLATLANLAFLGTKARLLGLRKSCPNERIRVCPDSR